MAPHHILVASYTTDIVTLRFDPAAGTLTPTAALTVGHHPSWITAHPRDPSLVFTALEQPDGRVLALRYGPDGRGTVVGEASSGGADPCFLLATDDELLVANYSSGTLAALPLSLTAPHFPGAPAIVQFRGSGPDAARQAGAHPHQVVRHGAELLVPDLGSDRTWRLARGAAGAWAVAGSIAYHAGAGPRHVVVHDGVIYTVLELLSAVSAHTLAGTWLATRSTLAAPPAPPHDMLAAALLLAPPPPPPPSPGAPSAPAPAPGPPLLYASNRNDKHPAGDSIAVFSIAPSLAPSPSPTASASSAPPSAPSPSDPAPSPAPLPAPPSPALTLLAEVRTGLAHLRALALAPGARWLAAGGVNDGGVRVFARGGGGGAGALREVARCEDVRAPTGFLWLGV